jgi:hypothetical protein
LFIPREANVVRPPRDVDDRLARLDRVVELSRIEEPDEDFRPISTLTRDVAANLLRLLGQDPELRDRLRIGQADEQVGLRLQIRSPSSVAAVEIIEPAPDVVELRAETYATPFSGQVRRFILPGVTAAAAFLSAFSVGAAT